MKVTNICRVIVFCVFICSCGRAQNDEIQMIHFDLHKLSMKSFSDFYQIKEVIPLETTDSSLIAGIDNIIFFEDKIVIGEYWTKAFSIFKRDGSFLGKVDKTGNGPEEYGSRIGSVVIDQADPDNTLIMNKSPQLFFYNYHTWKKVKATKWIGATAMLGSLPNGDFLAYQEFGNENEYFIKLVNQTGEIIKGFLPIPSQLSFTTPALYPYPFTFHQNNQVYVLPYNSHSIYEYNCKDTLLLEKYRFEIENNPSINIKRLKQQDIDNGTYYNDYYRLWLHNIDSSYMIISASVGGYNVNNPSITCIVNLKTLHAEVFNSGDLRDTHEEIPISHFIWTNLSFPVAIISPEKMENYATIRSDSWGTMLKRKISRDSNPILVIYEER